MAPPSTSRRQFIVSGTAGLLGAGVGLLPGSGILAAALSRITITESFVPTEWRQALAAAIETSGHAGDRAFWRAFAGTRVAGFPAGANGSQLLVLPAPGVEVLDPKSARRVAAISNDRLAEALAKDGGTAGLGTVSAFDPDGVREAERAITRLGLSGLSLGANRGMRLDARQLWPVYEFAQAASVPIYLPASYSASAGEAPYRQLGRGGVIAGASSDSSAHAVQLIFGGVLDAFPRLNVVLGRLGDAAPYWYSQLVAMEAGLAHGASYRPRRTVSDYFRSNIHLTTSGMQSAGTLQFCRANGCRVDFTGPAAAPLPA